MQVPIRVLEEWCRRDGRRQLIEAQADEQHAYVVELRWLAEPASVGQARAAVFCLVGAFAESAFRVGASQRKSVDESVDVGDGNCQGGVALSPQGRGNWSAEVHAHSCLVVRAERQAVVHP